MKLFRAQRVAIVPGGQRRLLGFETCEVRVKVFCSGRVVTGTDVVTRLSTGADACNSARATMMALG